MFNNSVLLRRVTVLAVLAALTAFEAAAWGPKAQSAVMNTSLQLLRREYSREYFDATEFKFHADLVRGALDGPREVLEIEINTEDDALNAISTEVNLLREARRFGVDSYFAYRMGSLGALVSNLYLPYALAIEDVPQAEELRRRIEKDVDAHLSTYQMKPVSRPMRYIRSPREYFSEDRYFTRRAADLVAADYATATGYDGYLSNGAEAFFERAVLAVADIWNTVLTTEDNGVEVKPSRRALTWYLVSEIEYELLERNNLRQAEKAYEHFASVNPGIIAAYERVGDHFYDYGAKDRAVEEWRIAVGFSGPERKRIAEKLANHFIEVGRSHIRQFNSPEPPDRSLEKAIEAFREALSVDRANNVAADLLAEAQVMKRENDEARQFAIELIASAEKVKKEADQSADERLYQDSITTYQQAIHIAENVDGRFQEQKKTADSIVADSEAAISRIMNQVLDDAQDAIDDGMAFVADNMFEEALKKFRSVEGILTVIPDDHTSPYAKTKLKLIEQAKKSNEECLTAQRRYEEEQAAQQQNQQPAGGGSVLNQ